MAFDFWKRAPTRVRRISTIVFFLLLSIVVTVSGILTPLTADEIGELGEQLEETQKAIDGLPELQQVSFIFGNNLMICLIGFTPVIGPVFEYYVLYSTGVVIGAYSSYENVQIDPVSLFFLLFLLPFTWLEFLAYSTAIAESFWLLWRVVKRKGKKEIRNSCIFISVCAVMLLVAAAIEAALV